MEGTSDIPLHMLPGLAASMKIMEAAEHKDAQKTAAGMESMGNRTPRSSASISAPKLQSFPEPEPLELLTHLPAGAAQESTQRTSKPMNVSNIEKSNLSPEIKKLMMEHQIEDPATYVNPSIGLAENTRADLMGITEDVIPKTKPLNNLTPPKVQAQEKMDAESIRKLVQEEVLAIMSETYANKIRKETIQNTIRTLKSKGLLK